MQEFSSISVSTYESGSLADRLTEQSADGWSVVAIVPTGSTITAYLSRSGSGGVATSARSTIATDVGGDVATSVESDSPDPVTEAPGWASGASTEPSSVTSSDPADDTPPVHVMPDAADASSESTVPLAATVEPAAGAAPAGWYADPSSRFELRYWDGAQWTEHVSRAGQQYTDPPVA